MSDMMEHPELVLPDRKQEGEPVGMAKRLLDLEAENARLKVQLAAHEAAVAKAKEGADPKFISAYPRFAEYRKLVHQEAGPDTEGNVLERDTMRLFDECERKGTVIASQSRELAAKDAELARLRNGIKAILASWRGTNQAMELELAALLDRAQPAQVEQDKTVGER